MQCQCVVILCCTITVLTSITSLCYLPPVSPCVFPSHTRQLEGNFRGEGLVLGGILVISPKNGVVYTYFEETGKEIPRQEIIDAVKAASASASGSGAPAWKFW